MSRSDRHRRHIEVAEYFASLGLPEVAGVVASHYLDALEAAPETQEVEELRTRALDALLAAADRAGALQSHAHVVHLCNRGIELSTSPTEQGELLIRAARAAHSGLDPDAEAYARRAMEAFEEAGASAGVLRSATTLARLLDDTGRSNEAWSILEPLVTAAGDDADPDSLAELARSFMLDGATDQALEWCDQALAAAEAADSIPVFVDTLITKGTGLGVKHRTRESLVLLEAGLELAKEHQLAASKRRVLRNLSYIRASDSPADPRESLERLEDARRLGDPRELTDSMIYRASNLLYRFEWEEVDRLLEGIDPRGLPPEIEDFYWGVVLEKKLWEGPTGPAIAERMARREQRSGIGDSQRLSSAEADIVVEDLMSSNFEASYERAAAKLPQVPIRLDLWFRMINATMLDDEERLAATAADAEANPFRGRHADAMKRACRGALAALRGKIDTAEDEWQVALDLAEEAYPIGIRIQLIATAAKSLGPASTLGRECGQRAYTTLTERGAYGLMEPFPDLFVAPTEVAEETG